ncbi:MAG: hypothetical protein PHD30_04830, partial [Paludibacter sp.]|nr:hypothetical protein [Paludibacter sp.]
RYKILNLRYICRFIIHLEEKQQKVILLLYNILNRYHRKIGPFHSWKWTNYIQETLVIAYL